MSFDLYPGEVITLLGRNGAGKTTTLRSIIGILPKRSGSILVDGVETIGLSSRHVARLGVGYCPEERGIFSSLSVEENLMLPPKIKPGGLTVERIYSFFPTSRSGARARAPSSPAASSRCSPSPASYEPARTRFFSTSRPKGWRRSSFSRSAAPSVS